MTYRILRLGVAAALLAVFCTESIAAQRIRDRIRERRAARQGGNTRAPAARPATSCDAAPNLGFRILRFSSGLRAAAWYPTTDAERPFTYANSLVSSIAENAPVSPCGLHPVAIFSHGFGGCSTQSLTFTEDLARHGFVVIAPDHKDAGCKVDQPREGRLFHRAEEPFRRPSAWTDQTYVDRRDDIRLILDESPKMPEWAGRLDTAHISGVGHSLGGYTMLAMAGAWQSWKDPRIRAVLLFSPYSSPFLSHSTITHVDVPVMYQGGDRDRGITPGVKKAGGLYEQSRLPKYYVELKKQGHLGWTVQPCGRGAEVNSCVATHPNLAAVNRFGIAFLERYGEQGGTERKPDPLEVASGNRTGVSEYRARD